MPTREEAIALWKKYNQQESLYHHALSVEAVMRYFAQKYRQDEELWGLVGLLHDVDYEKYPEEHLQHTKEILEPAGYSQEIVRAIESHGWMLVNDVEPRSLLEKTLYTVDELSGFISACSYVRPSKSVLDLELKSVKKKWKTTAFAAGVRRDIVEKGAELMEVPLDELITDAILALRTVAAEVGLKGNL